MELARRGFLVGIGSLVCMPAIAKVAPLMKIKGVSLTRWIDIPAWCPSGFIPFDNSRLTKQQFPDLHAWFKRCRQGGAHLGDDFTLNGPLKDECHMSYETVQFYSAAKEPLLSNNETFQVTLISTQPLKRANGTVAWPGMIHRYRVNAPVLKAESPSYYCNGVFVNDYSSLKSKDHKNWGDGIDIPARQE